MNQLTGPSAAAGAPWCKYGCSNYTGLHLKLQQRRARRWPRVRCCRWLCCVPPAACICKPWIDEGGGWVVALTCFLPGAHEQGKGCCWEQRWILDTLSTKTNLCTAVFWLKKVVGGIFTPARWRFLTRLSQISAAYNHLQLGFQVKVDMFGAAEARVEQK